MASAAGHLLSFSKKRSPIVSEPEMNDSHRIVLEKTPSLDTVVPVAIERHDGTSAPDAVSPIADADAAPLAGIARMSPSSYALYRSLFKPKGGFADRVDGYSSTSLHFDEAHLVAPPAIDAPTAEAAVSQVPTPAATDAPAAPQIADPIMAFAAGEALAAPGEDEPASSTSAPNATPTPTVAEPAPTPEAEPAVAADEDVDAEEQEAPEEAPDEDARDKAEDEAPEEAGALAAALAASTAQPAGVSTPAAPNASFTRDRNSSAPSSNLNNIDQWFLSTSVSGLAYEHVNVGQGTSHFFLRDTAGMRHHAITRTSDRVIAHKIPNNDQLDTSNLAESVRLAVMQFNGNFSIENSTPEAEAKIARLVRVLMASNALVGADGSALREVYLNGRRIDQTLEVVPPSRPSVLPAATAAPVSARVA